MLIDRKGQCKKSLIRFIEPIQYWCEQYRKKLHFCDCGGMNYRLMTACNDASVVREINSYFQHKRRNPRRTGVVSYSFGVIHGYVTNCGIKITELVSYSAIVKSFIIQITGLKIEEIGAKDLPNL